MGLGSVLKGIGKGVGRIFGGPELPAIASVAGSIIDRQASQAANKANAQNVRDQMAFQQQQSETQYQRAVKDMMAAGLNPGLAYQQGGNSAQGGAAADYKPNTAGNQLARAVEAYNQFATGTAQREVLRAQAYKTHNEAAILEPEMNAAIRPDSRTEIQERIRAENRARRYQADYLPVRYRSEIEQINQSTATAKQQEALLKTQATLNEQDFQNAWFRKNISPYLNSTAKGMEALSGLHYGRRDIKGLIRGY